MIKITTSGDFNHTDKFLKAMQEEFILDVLNDYGAKGVDALASATPTKSGLTARSWSYEVGKYGGAYMITWTNSNIDKTGTPIVIRLQYGHGTGTGGYVRGIDFINPTLRPIFDEISEGVWRVVTSA